MDYVLSSMDLAQEQLTKQRADSRRLHSNQMDSRANRKDRVSGSPREPSLASGAESDSRLLARAQRLEFTFLRSRAWLTGRSAHVAPALLYSRVLAIKQSKKRRGS